MVLLEFEKSLEPLVKKLENLKEGKKKEVEEEIRKNLEKIYKDLTPWQKTLISRHPNRPYAMDYVDNLFKDVVYLSGDRLGYDDGCTIGGLATFQGTPLVFVGQQKGRNLEENMKYNFGMPKPEGYRKALRLFEMANNFGKPIVTLIDTPGAYPGLEGEERSQAEAIARNLREMARLKVPVVAIVIGEGGSGGALGIAVANQVFMLENSIYSVISPESCASILWKDASKKEEAARLLKNDSQTAKKWGIVDKIIEEGVGGAHRNWNLVMDNVSAALSEFLKTFGKLSSHELVENRMKKFANIGFVQVDKKAPSKKI